MNAVEFSHHYAELSDVRMHYVTAGAGDPVMLLHGWPQTWYEWRAVMSLLADRYLLIAPDLRGLGDTSKPAGGYDTATLAADVWELLTSAFDFDRFHLVGHDWGGPVGFALAAAQPQAVRTLSIIDVAIPGDGNANVSQGGKRWHHAFHQTPELPEALITGREHIYLTWFYRNYGATPDAVSDDAIAEYLRCYTDPETLRAGFEYYRNIPRDIAQNEVILQNFKLPMPVLALGGAAGWGRRDEVVASCRRVAKDVRGGIVEGAGHWIPEEQPAVLAGHLRELFESCA